MEIICDDRERQVHLLAKDKYDNVFVEHLTVGDYLIGRRNDDGLFIPYIVVERKTWSDLASSVKDQRVQNIIKLRAYRDETGARIAYLLEGEVKNPGGAIIDGIPYKSLRSHIDHLLYRDNIIELHTTSPADSLRRLLEFAANLEILPCNSVVDGLAAAKVKHVLTDEQISDKIWSTFGGLSITSARAFRHLRIAGLYTGEIQPADLAAVQTGARRFGVARADAIFNSLSKESTLERLLCAVPKIATKKARLILDCLHKTDAEGHMVPVPLSSLFVEWGEFKGKIEEKIGKICARNIEQYLM